MTVVAEFPDEALGRARGIALVIAAGVFWSTIGLGVRLIEDASAWQILFYRSISLTAFLYLVIRLRTGVSPFAHIRRTGWPGVIGALSLLGAYSGGIYALQNTSVATAMVVFASAPFMAALLGLVILKERVRPTTWLAILAACAGIMVMVWGETSGTAMRGNLAALGSAFGFAAFTVALRWGRRGEMMPAVFLSGFMAIFVMGGICLFLGLPLAMDAADTGIALGMGVFQVGIGLVLYTIGSRNVPAAELTLLSLAEVLLAPLWVWLALGETVPVKTLLGGAILLGAIAANALSGTRLRKPPPPAH